MEEQCLCGNHNNVEKLTMNPVQKSNGTTQFKCIVCNAAVIKSTFTNEDVLFLRHFKRHHKLCINHEENRPFLPTLKQENGREACLWCGEEVTVLEK